MPKLIKHLNGASSESLIRKFSQDPTLSMKALGLLVFLNNWPNGHDFKTQDIVNDDPHGRGYIWSGLHELVRHGCLEFQRPFSAQASLESYWIIHPGTRKSK